jgi:hypothetical protein
MQRLHKRLRLFRYQSFDRRDWSKEEIAAALEVLQKSNLVRLRRTVFCPHGDPPHEAWASEEMSPLPDFEFFPCETCGLALGEDTPHENVIFRLKSPSRNK